MQSVSHISSQYVWTVKEVFRLHAAWYRSSWYMASTRCSCFMITLTVSLTACQSDQSSMWDRLLLSGSSLSADLSTNMCTGKTMGCGLGCVSVVPKYCPCLVEGLLNQWSVIMWVLKAHEELDNVATSDLVIVHTLCKEEVFCEEIYWTCSCS